MSVTTALPAPTVNITDIWTLDIRRLAAIGTDSLFMQVVQQPSETDGNALVRTRTVAGELQTAFEIATGLYGIVSNQSDLAFAGDEITQGHLVGNGRVPVEEYWLGGTVAKNRTRDQIWRMDWGPTLVDTINSDGAGSMWYGVGIGGATDMSGAADSWGGCGFLGWLWDRSLAGGIANWTLCLRAEDQTLALNVDSGLAVADSRHLQVHIGQENGAAVARWISDGGLVREESLPGTSFAPTFTNDQRNWGPTVIGARGVPLTNGFRGWTALQGIARLDLVTPFE